MVEVEAQLFFQGAKIFGFKGSLSDFSLNGFTKLSPIRWTQQPADFAVFADGSMNQKSIDDSVSAKKVGLVLEPMEIAPGITRAAKRHRDRLDIILTFQDELLKLGKPFHPYIPGGIQLTPLDVIPSRSKSKLVSISASSKNLTAGHRLRHHIVKKFSNFKELEVMGQGYAPYSHPLDPYSDFAYSICVENTRDTYNFTEKLLHALLSKTVPIYWGGSIVSKFFDPRGIIFFDELRELNGILSSISSEDYARRREAVESNFVKAQSFISKELNILVALEKAGVIPKSYEAAPRAVLRPGDKIEPDRRENHFANLRSPAQRFCDFWTYRLNFW